MQLAKVVGSVVSTQKSSSLVGKKLMLVQRLNVAEDGSPISTSDHRLEVAIDSVGAGEGEIVLVTRGASARMVFTQPNEAIDLSIVAIVDSISTNHY